MESKAVLNAPEANPPVAEEKTVGGDRWDQVRSAVLHRGWRLGKRVAIAGAAISCALVMIPPLLFFSTLGLAVAFPFGVYLASFACTDLLMRSLLSPPPQEEEEEEKEFFEPEEEVDSEGEKKEAEEGKENGEENVPQLDHDIEEKGDGGMALEERQREEAGMDEGKEAVEDNKEEDCGVGMLFHDEDMRKDFAVNLVPVELVYPDDKYPSEVFEDWNRVEIVAEEQLMEEMKMPKALLVENEKNREVEGTAQGLPPTAFLFESVASLEKEIEPSSQYASAEEVGGARLGYGTGGEGKMEEEIGCGEQKEAEAEVKEEEGLDAAAPKSKESVPNADEVSEDREVEIVPGVEHASDSKDGGDSGLRELVGQKKGVEEKGLNKGGGDSPAQELPPSVDPSLVMAPQDKPMEEMEMGEELGAEQKGNNEDIVCFALEHESKIELSSLSLVCGSTFEKGYEAAVGIIEEEMPTEEVGLGEAYATEVKWYEGNVGITEEEKLTEEVAFADAYSFEKVYGRDVVILEEEKPREEVGLGEASAVEEKRNQGHVGLVEDEKLTEEVGEEREEKEKEDERVDSAGFESENLLPSAIPSVARALGASKIEIEQSSDFAADVKEGGNRGSVRLVEEEKPVGQIEMREKNTTEGKGRKEDDVDASAQKPPQNVYPSSNVVLEEQEDSVRPSRLSSECASMFKGNGHGECVETVEEEKLTEGAGLGKEIEEVEKGDEAVDTAVLESEKLLPSVYASVAALPKECKAETEPSSQLACDGKNSGNKGDIGLVGEKKLLKETDGREEKEVEVNEYTVGAAAQGFSHCVYPSVGEVLEQYMNQVNQSNPSSVFASVTTERGNEGGVEMIEEKKPTEGMDLGEERDRGNEEEDCVVSAAMETEKVSLRAYPSESVATEVCEVEIELPSFNSEYASFVKDDGERIGIKLVEKVQPTKEILMEIKSEAENKVMKQECVGPKNKEQLQNAEHFVDVVSTAQKIETEESGVSMCDSSVVKQNEDGDCIVVLEGKILRSNGSGTREEREVLAEGKEEEGDSAAAPKNDEAESSVGGVDAVVAMEIKCENEPSSFNSDYVPVVEYQSLDMAETVGRSSIEHGLDPSPGPEVIAMDAEVPVSSDDEGLYSEDELWEQIFAIRTIMGYKAALQLSLVEEFKALFLVIGVKLPASMKDDSDLVELNEMLRFLKSVIGVQ